MSRRHRIKARQLKPNRPTELGRALGAEVARLADVAAAAGDYPERCKTCAFRGGTLPNGCEETLMDAMKCVIEGKPFMCHQTFDANDEPTEVCAGWLAARVETEDVTADIEAPWPYSPTPTDEQIAEYMSARAGT